MPQSYVAYVPDWKPNVLNEWAYSDVFDYEDDAHAEAQRILNERYLGKWTYKVSTGQYIHVNSRLGDEVLAYIRHKLSPADKLERDISAAEKDIEMLQRRLETLRNELKEVLNTETPKL